MPEQDKLNDFSLITPNIENYPSSSDCNAQNEEKSLFEVQRENLQKETHRIIVWALRVGALVIGILIIIRFWHLAGPHAYRWLDDVEIQNMDKMLFSSAFGGLVLGYLKEILLPLKSKK